MRNILLVIDLQKDFIYGSLTVPGATQVLPAINEVKDRFDSVYFTLDWHPVNHCSFREQGGPWPVHCVAKTPGAEFHPELELPVDAMIFDKGTKTEADAYSAFDGTPAASVLHDAGIERLVVCGLATDYCVKATVLDALKEGFAVSVVRDGCRAVNVAPDDGEKALAEMVSAGATVCDLDDLKG